MTRDDVVGMFVGAFLGDMLGAPYEFQEPMNPNDVVVTTGGSHDVSLGEYTDDGALTLALAESYLACNGFNAQDASLRFKDWYATGKYGTRDHVFDVGRTTAAAIGAMDHDRPFAATGGKHDSGNGSLMRIAACLAANHNNSMQALAESVAASLMTHGNADILKYTAAFVAEVMGPVQPQFHSLYFNPSNPKVKKGSVMYAFNAARHAVHYGRGDGGATLRHAVSYGWDTDTNACIAGMWVGAMHGIECFPPEYIAVLQNKDRIFEVANALYDMGVAK